jgi:hypothetical protein
MNLSSIFIAIAIIALAVVACLVFVIGGRSNQRRLTPLAGLAFGFITAGIVFGEERAIGYGLMVIGLLLAVIDLFNRPSST